MTARRPRTMPRKRPKQERSRNTVDVILQAAQRVLARNGLRGLTTARIAEVAGISVGSLYQYFPSKEAVCGALVEQAFERYEQVVRTALEATRGLSIDDAIRRVVGGLVRVLADTPQLHAELTEVLSPAGRRDAYHRALARYTNALADYLVSRRDELRVDPQRAAYLLVRAGDGLAQALAHDRPPPAELDALTDEMCDMLLRYAKKT